MCGDSGNLSPADFEEKVEIASEDKHGRRYKRPGQTLREDRYVAIFTAEERKAHRGLEWEASRFARMG